MASLSASLFSPSWHRIADRRPRLRAGVQVTRQLTRGVAWHALTDPMSGRRCRLNPQAWAVAGRLDGERTVEQIWEEVLARQPGEVPSQDEVVQLIGQLSAEGLVTLDALPDFASRAWRRGQRAVRQRREAFNPLALRVPLGCPAPLLDRLAPVGRRVFSRTALMLWLALMGLALTVLLPLWPQLLAQAGDRLATPWMLFLVWLLYMPVKVLHELAHGLAARRFGVDVPEAGVTLLVLMPSPYVDVSDSAALGRRGERLAIAGAGIASDLAVAALGLLVWAEAGPGLWRDAALAAIIVAGVGTVLFNLNPLLRFDGYHLLCDALDLPQLATRSQRLWQQRWRVWAGTDASVSQPAPMARDERLWLEAYAPLAFICRLVLGLGIALLAGGFSGVLGLLVFAYVIVVIVIWPAFKLARDLLSATRGTAAHGPMRVRGLFLLAGCAGLAGVLPLPFHSTVQGVIKVSESGVLRPEVEGLVIAVHARDGETIRVGDTVLTLDDPVLRARLARAEARVSDIEAERFGQIGRDALRATDGEDALARARAEVAELQSRVEKLELRALAGGRLSLPFAGDLPGAWLARGASVGHVLEGTALRVRAAVPESQAGLLRERLRGVEVRLAHDSGAVLAGKVVREAPAAVMELPGEALGRLGDGGIETDPADLRGMRSKNPYVHVDVQVDARHAQWIDGRAWVRFDYGWATLLERGWRAMRQVFLRRFAAAG